MKILLVDDNAKWIQFIKKVFGKDSVDKADSPKSGYDLIIGSSYAIDKFEEVRDRFVISTYYPNVKEAIKSFRLGALDYISKDFTEETILDKILSLLIRK